MWALCETYRVLDICILGIAEALSLVSSWHTLPMVLKNPMIVEGAQIASQRAGATLKSVDKILITHLHANHISGCRLAAYHGGYGALEGFAHYQFPSSIACGDCSVNDYLEVSD